ncbi:unnamed protein product, partial [Musa acuminata subsp. burmannicoides]
PHHLKYEKNTKIKEAITRKFTEYLRRAEDIRAVLDGGGTGPAANGDAAVVARPKTKPKNGDGNGGEDPDQAKPRSELATAIITEKPQREVERCGQAGERQAGLAGGCDLAGQVPSILHRQTKAMEGISFVWSTWNWKVIPGKGCCNRGRINVFQMKLIPYVANMEKAMKLKLLEESRQNFLVQMQGVGNNDQKVLILAATNAPYAL